MTTGNAPDPKLHVVSSRNRTLLSSTKFCALPDPVLPCRLATRTAKPGPLQQLSFTMTGREEVCSAPAAVKELPVTLTWASAPCAVGQSDPLLIVSAS